MRTAPRRSNSRGTSMRMRSGIRRAVEARGRTRGPHRPEPRVRRDGRAAERSGAQGRSGVWAGRFGPVERVGATGRSASSGGRSSPGGGGEAPRSRRATGRWCRSREGRAGREWAWRSPVGNEKTRKRRVSRRRRPDKAGRLTFVSGDGPGRPGRRKSRPEGDQGRSGAAASSTGGPERAAASSASSRCQIKMEWPTLASGRGWCRSQAQRRLNRSFS